MTERSAWYGGLEIFAVITAGVSFAQAEEHDDNSHHLGMGFLIRYRHMAGDFSVTRYEINEFQRWNYLPCRRDLEKLFRFLSDLSGRHGVSFFGREVEKGVYDRIGQGRILPDQLEKALI